MERFVVRTTREAAFASASAQRSSGSRGQRTLGSLAKVVTLPRGVTARVFSNEYLIRMKEVLEDPESSEETLVDTIRQLSSLLMTEKHLLDTGLGKTVKNLSKQARFPQVQPLAASLRSAWRQAVDEERNGTSAAVGPARGGAQSRAAARTPYARPGGGGGASGRAAAPQPQQHQEQQPRAPLRVCDDGLSPLSAQDRDKAKSLLAGALMASRDGGSAEEVGAGDSPAAGHARRTAAEVEAGVAGALGAAPQAYRRKARELVANLRRNEVLRSKVLAGWVAPRQLVRLTPAELASREHDFDAAS